MVNNIKNIHLTLIFILMVLVKTFYSCAAEGMPPGGPKDETAPSIISTFPSNNALNVENDVVILFEFSEPVDYKSVENSLTIFPAMENRPSIKINKNKVKIKLSENLKKNTTYIFSFGRKVQDYQKNITDGEIKIAFSTGAKLDNSSISGRLYDFHDTKKTAYILLYENKSENMDSLIFQKPVYYTSVDKNGLYKATNIAIGKYSVVAYIGSFKDQPRFSEEDFTAVGFQEFLEVKTENDTIRNIDMRIGNYPLKHFQYLKTIEEEGKIDLMFSHPILQENLDNINIQINNISMKRQIWLTADDPDKIHLDFTDFDSSEYSLNISGVQDIFDREMERSLDTFVWNNKETIDTIGASVKFINPQRDEAAIDDVIRFKFSEPVKCENNFTDRITLIDKDSTDILFDIIKKDLTLFEIHPKKLLKYFSQYKVSLLTDSIFDFSGNNAIDSIKQFAFKTINKDLFGMISGKIESEFELEKIIVCCIHEKKNKLVYKVKVKSNGTYLLENLYPGDYSIYLFLDENENEKYDWGSLIPYQPAERYRQYFQKISVRSRWETEGVNIKF